MYSENRRELHSCEVTFKNFYEGKHRKIFYLIELQVILKPSLEVTSQSIMTTTEYDLFKFKIADRYSGLRGVRERMLNILIMERMASEFNNSQQQ